MEKLIIIVTAITAVLNLTTALSNRFKKVEPKETKIIEEGKKEEETKVQKKKDTKRQHPRRH